MTNTLIFTSLIPSLFSISVTWIGLLIKSKIDTAKYRKDIVYKRIASFYLDYCFVAEFLKRSNITIHDWSLSVADGYIYDFYHYDVRYPGFENYLEEVDGFRKNCEKLAQHILYLLPLIEKEDQLRLNEFLDLMSMAIERIDNVSRRLRNENTDVDLEILNKADLDVLNQSDCVIKKYVKVDFGMDKN
ncbi:hypothetical protein DIS16_09860 [Levilactobacillus brevis]|uniref:hypothetical protein n=1 Tax=Levilactobacillus brevis TaxID=1580 RepID=UPI001121C741|nr:hypothetical protein [Levilactobacillus brevis]TOY75085.1 hypothetical protein DIS16_09860 [Levilactobacillus brevis]